MACFLKNPMILFVVLTLALSSFANVLESGDDDSAKISRKIPKFSFNKLRNSRVTPTAAALSSPSVPTDLEPLAQSYFIIPETPSTTTVKTVFRRRKTKRPISSLVEQKKKATIKYDTATDSNTEVDNSNYNPLSQLLDTGFQSNKKQQPNIDRKKRPSSSSSLSMMVRDHSKNINEGVAPILSDNNNGVNHKNHNGQVNVAPVAETSSPNSQRQTGNPRFGKRKTKKATIGNEGNTNAETSRNVEIVPKSKLINDSENTKRSQRFVPQKRRHNPSSVTQGPSSSSASNDVSSTTSASVGQSSRSGRRFGGSYNKPNKKVETVTEILPKPEALSQDDQKPLRRRKKFSTSTPSDGNIDVEKIVNELGSVVVSSPSKPPIRQPKIKHDIFGSRKPFSLHRAATSSSISSVQEEEHGPKIRGMRLRPVYPKQSVVSTVMQPENEQQPQSSDAITILADAADSIGQTVNTEEFVLNNVSSSSNSSTTEIPHPQLPVAPRNLSNRRPNPLDKFSNRQASGRRFLTSKASSATESNGETNLPQQTTTKAPAKAITTRANRKSPLSLSNLRNRRLGSSSTTTSTTEPPTIDVAVGELEQLNSTKTNTEISTNETLVTNATNGTDIISTSADGQDETLSAVPAPEEKKSPLSGLLKNRRPPPRLPKNNASPGQSPAVTIPIKPRGPILKPKPTEPTTSKPANVEATTIPSCEEGKRYNKILRKCIPNFTSKSG